eukprot:406029-Rhodomonas_salina.1
MPRGEAQLRSHQTFEPTARAGDARGAGNRYLGHLLRSSVGGCGGENEPPGRSFCAFVVQFQRV